MQKDETEVRALIERWAKAVRACDMDGVLADHADDIVMFDVPPPENGVRGIDAYRETWPPFFKWQAQGARALGRRTRASLIPRERLRGDTSHAQSCARAGRLVIRGLADPRCTTD